MISGGAEGGGGGGFCESGEDACSYFVNPFTVVSIVEAVRSRKGKAFIHTAAASQLGQMMVKYCQQEGASACKGDIYIYTHTLLYIFTMTYSPFYVLLYIVVPCKSVQFA